MPTPFVNKRTDTSHASPCMHDWEKKRRDEHHRKQLEKMKPTLDTRTPPASQPHLTLYGRDYAAKKKATTEAAFADLKMIQSIAKTMTRPVTIPERQGPVSLNADYRKQQIRKIMKDNHTLLGGIESVKPCMNTMESVNEHREKMRYVILGSSAARKSGCYDDHIQHFKIQDKTLVEKQKSSTNLRKESLKMRRTEGADPKSLNGSQSLPQMPMANQTAPAASGSRLGPLAAASAKARTAPPPATAPPEAWAPEEEAAAPGASEDWAAALEGEEAAVPAAASDAPAEPPAAVAAPGPEGEAQSNEWAAALEEAAPTDTGITAEQMVKKDAGLEPPAPEAGDWAAALEQEAGSAA